MCRDRGPPWSRPTDIARRRYTRAATQYSKPPHGAAALAAVGAVGITLPKSSSSEYSISVRVDGFIVERHLIGSRVVSKAVVSTSSAVILLLAIRRCARAAGLGVAVGAYSRHARDSAGARVPSASSSTIAKHGDRRGRQKPRRLIDAVAADAIGIEDRRSKSCAAVGESGVARLTSTPKGGRPSCEAETRGSASCAMNRHFFGHIPASKERLNRTGTNGAIRSSPGSVIPTR